MHPLGAGLDVVAVGVGRGRGQDRQQRRGGDDGGGEQQAAGLGSHWELLVPIGISSTNEESRDYVANSLFEVVP